MGEAVFRSSIAYNPERIGAAAIYCSDGRYNEQFDEFLHAHLGLPRYDRVVVPGGAACLAGDVSAWRDEEAVAEQLRFLIESHALERVVLIAHRGCGFYLKRLHVREEALRARQAEDLAKAAERIRGLGRVRVEAYIAAVEGGRVEFEGVAVE
ncbi:MAG: carbonic anhydrase [Phycisphaerales bacterium]